MSDQFKHKPINIPIESDDDADSDRPGVDEDVFEIDGDAVDFDAPILESDEVESDPVAVDAGEPPVSAPSGSAHRAAEPPGAPVEGEISREAVFSMMQELRQKSEMLVRVGEEKADLYDKLLRKQAEFENFRKRNEREMQEAYIRARADLLGEMLPVLDNFTLALQHADTATPEVIHEGVQLINKQLFDTMARLGLEPIDAEGQPFNPELHEAVVTETRDDVPDHTVVAVLQQGYKHGDRLLRPARVKVAVQPDRG